MTLFSAEAFFASSTSKSGIRIHLTEHEDFSSSTKSTISTSLIHCIASVGNSEQVHTSVLNLIFQEANVAGVDNLSKWRSEICSRCWSDPYFLKESPSLGMTEFLADGPYWHLWSWTGVWFSLFTACDEWICSDFWELHGFNSCDLRCWGRRCWICKNVSRKTLRVPYAWRPIFAARHSQRTASHSTKTWMRWERNWLTGNVGMSTAYWFSISLESFIQLMSFCNSWILPVSSRIVSRSSINFLLVIVSNVEPWNRFNCFITLRLFSWASRRFQFCFNNCSWKSW